MAVRLRQIALAARELEPTVERICAVLGVEVAHHDPGVGIFGLHNALLPLGNDQFLEVVSPTRPETTVGRLLDKHRADVCGYMAIFQTDDLAGARHRAESLGLAVVWEIDIGEAATFHLHPKDLGAVVSFDLMKTWDDWLWAGPDWREYRGKGDMLGLAGVTVALPDPAGAAAKWRGLLGDVGDAVSVVPAGDRLGGLTSFALRTSVSLEAIQARARAAGLPVTERGFRLGEAEIQLSQSRLM